MLANAGKWGPLPGSMKAALRSSAMARRQLRGPLGVLLGSISLILLPSCRLEAARAPQIGET